MSYWDSNKENPIPRHRADDDVQALASGSFAPGTRTPNGLTDLLDRESSVSPLDSSITDIPYNRFNDDALHQHLANAGESDPSSAASSGLQETITTNSKEWVEKGSKLAEKTSKIMEDYRSYLTEIDSEFSRRSSVGEGTSSKLATDNGSSYNNSNSYNNSGNSNSSSSYGMNSKQLQEKRAEDYIEEVRSAYRDQYHDQHARSLNDDVSFAPPSSGGSGGSQLLKRSWARDSPGRPARDAVSLDMPPDPDGRIADGKYGPAALGFGDHVRSEYGMGHYKGAKYAHLFYSKRVKRGIVAFVASCAVIGMVAGITSSVKKSRKEKNLPDWQAELAEVEKDREQEKEKKKELNAQVMVGIERPPSSPEGMDGEEGDEAANEDEEIASSEKENHSLTDEQKQTIEEMTIRYDPAWFTRSDGWVGQTYSSAIEFCSSQQSMVPCPLEAYCPLGKESMPYGGLKSDSTAWAPVYDKANEWVQIGQAEKACVLFSEVNGSTPNWGVSGEKNEELTRHIMCCREADEKGAAGGEDDVQSAVAESKAPMAATLTDKEQEILNTHHPLWFGRKEGYHGTTYADAKDFCKKEAQMQLCPQEAYCPNGITEDGSMKPLFLNLDAFGGEQWAPLYGEENTWILVGKLHDDPSSTCRTYYEMNGRREPSWGLDGTSTELKERILCCVDPSQRGHVVEEPIEFYPDKTQEQQKEQNVDANAGTDADTDTAANTDADAVTDAASQSDSTAATEEKHSISTELFMMNKMKPYWIGPKEGWTGGSHDDAMEFCKTIRGKQLCPYGAYCPYGAGNHVMGRHKNVDFNKMGEIYAPVYGKENYWIMIGQKDGNSATTCMSHHQLEGSHPDWGLNSDNPELKPYIMCCNM
ncbi:hypothetical protein ACHAXS_003191 [Conticribra weissflogii]